MSNRVQRSLGIAIAFGMLFVSILACDQRRDFGDLEVGNPMRFQPYSGEEHRFHATVEPNTHYELEIRVLDRFLHKETSPSSINETCVASPEDEKEIGHWCFISSAAGDLYFNIVWSGDNEWAEVELRRLDP